MDVSLGIDIGSFSIKLAEVESASGKHKLVNYQEFPLSLNPNQDKKLEIVEILRTIAQQNQHRPDVKVALSLPQSAVSVHRTEFPFKERHKILKSLAFELEDDLPLSQDSAIFDAKVLSYTGPLSQVLALATPAEHIEDHIQLAQDGSLNLNILSSEALALSNLFDHWLDSPPEESLIELADDDEDDTDAPASPGEVILNIGHEKSFALILKEGRLSDVRTMDWGGAKLYEYVGDKLKLQTTEAYKRIQLNPKFAMGPGEGSDSLEVSTYMNEALAIFASELKLILLETQSRLNINISSVQLCGGFSLYKNIGPLLTQFVQVPCNRLTQFKMNPNLDIGISMDTPQVITCGVALGLAIENLKRPKNPAINFLKDEFAQQSEAFQQFWGKWSYAVKIGGAFFVALIIYGSLRSTFSLDMADQAHSKMQKHAKSIAGLKGRKASLRGVKKYIKSQKKVLRNIELAENVKNISSSLNFVKSLSQSSPSGHSLQMNVKQFVLNHKTLRVTGEIKSAQSLARLESSLKSLAKGGKIKKVPARGKMQAGWTSFGYEIQLSSGSK